MKITEENESFRKERENKFWCDFIKRIQDEVTQDKLKIYGYESLIQDVLTFHKKYGINQVRYHELIVLPRKIADLIYNMIYNGCYNQEDIACLTTYITKREYQKVLFNSECSFKRTTSPEYFFEKVLWTNIIRTELFDNDYIRYNFEEWFKSCFFVIKKNKGKRKRKKADCCSYFLTFFALAFMLNLSPKMGYEKYIELINKFENTPEILFLFRYIMFLVLRNLNSVNSTYFNQINTLVSYTDVLKQFSKDKDTWFKMDTTQFTLSFEKSVKDTIVKILYKNGKSSQNEMYFAEYTIASEILGKDFSEDEEWQKIINEIDEICAEVFVR